MDGFEIVLIAVAGLIWVIQKLVEGARKIRQSSLTPDEKRMLKQERLDEQRASKEGKATESVLFPSARPEASPLLPPALAPAPPVVVAPPKRHPPRLDLGAEPEPVDRAEAMQMLWQQAVEAEQPALAPEQTTRRQVANAEVQHGYVKHVGFDRRALRRLLASQSSLRTAILLREIIGPPKAMRR